MVALNWSAMAAYNKRTCGKQFAGLWKADHKPLSNDTGELRSGVAPQPSAELTNANPGIREDAVQGVKPT